MKQSISVFLNRTGDWLRNIKCRDFLLILLGILLISYTITSITASRKKAAELSIAGQTLNGPEITSFLYNSEKFRQLKYEEAWLSSCITAAKKNIFTLAVDLPDSTLSINLGGTMLYHARAEKISPEKWFSSLSPEALLSLQSSPQILTRQWATFKKEPIVIKQAPENSQEALAPQTIPDTTITKPLMMLLSLDNQINLAIIQSDKTKGYGRAKLSLKMHLEGKRAAATIRSMFNRKNKIYIPLITLEIPQKNCETIYRALPDSALVTLRINNLN